MIDYELYIGLGSQIIYRLSKLGLGSVIELNKLDDDIIWDYWELNNFDIQYERTYMDRSNKLIESKNK